MRKCCGREPDVFHDQRIGTWEPLVVINCAVCGRFAEGVTREKAEAEWEAKHTQTNPR